MVLLFLYQQTAFCNLWAVFYNIAIYLFSVLSINLKLADIPEKNPWVYEKLEVSEQLFFYFVSVKVWNHALACFIVYKGGKM